MSLFSNKFKSNIVICGHFGCGKTNVAVGMALDAVRCGRHCGIADLDIVNPYFRTADSEPLLRSSGIDCFIPRFANTNVDIPSLGGEISSVFAKQETDPSYTAVFDVGGDNGAVVLGRYRDRLLTDYTMILVVNRFRPLTALPADAAEGLREIERCCGLRASYLINNSNLGRQTSYKDIVSSFSYADEISDLTELPLLCTTLHDSDLAEKLTNDYPERLFLTMPDSTRRLF